MRTATLALLVWLPLAGIASVACRNADAGDPVAGARDALAGWAASFRTGDPAATAAWYEQSPHVVQVHSFGRRDQGIDAVLAGYRAGHDGVVFEDVALEDLVVRGDGAVAWANARLVMKTRDRSGGLAWLLDLHLSFVLRRGESGWRIVLEHATAREGVPRIRPREER